MRCSVVWDSFKFIVYFSDTLTSLALDVLVKSGSKRDGLFYFFFFVGQCEVFVCLDFVHFFSPWPL